MGEHEALAKALEALSSRMNEMDKRHHETHLKGDERHAQMINKFDSLNASLSKMAVILEKITQIEKLRTQDSQKIDNIDKEVTLLKSDIDQGKGTLSFLKIASGLITLVLVASFTWVFNTSAWIAKIDQWKIQVEEKLK